MNDDLMNSLGYTPTSEAKGSDVRAACEVAAKNLNQAIGVHLLRSDSIGCFTEEQAARVIEKVISPILEARVQAAAVEVRGKVVAYIREHYHVFRSDEFAREVENVVRALSIPTDALDAMLLRARIEELDSWAKHAAHDWHCPEKKTGKGPCWVCERKAEIKHQLAALTQPAPEKEQK